MDETYALACARYIELNPVRAKLTSRPSAWPWSSAKAHLAAKDDELVCVRPLLDLSPDWKDFLAASLADHDREAIRAGERTGRPLGSPRFVARLEKRLDRTLTRQKPGPKPKKQKMR